MLTQLLIIFLQRKVNMGIKLTFLLYLCGEITHIFVFSYYGEKITEVVIYNVIYEITYMLIQNGPQNRFPYKCIYCMHYST